MVRSHNNEEKTELPQWQYDLVKQIVRATENYYWRKEKMEEDNFEDGLVKHLQEINRRSRLLKDIDSSHSTDFSSKELLSENDKSEFARQVNLYLEGFDPHLILSCHPPEANEWYNAHIKQIDSESHFVEFDSDPANPDEETLAARYPWWNERNFGFIKDAPDDEKIQPETGYIKITNFADLRWGSNPDIVINRLGLDAKAAALLAMESLRDKKAIIFDLRDSHGGSPNMVQYILSFFLEPGTELNSIKDFLTGETEKFVTIPTEFKLPDVPVYILVDENTFSASEEFAYDLQQIEKEFGGNRFTLIGQPTNGASHPMLGFPLIVDPETMTFDRDFTLFVPHANATNPYSGTNWEDGPQKGVQPDIVTGPREDALKVAQQQIQLKSVQVYGGNKSEATEEKKSKLHSPARLRGTMFSVSLGSDTEHETNQATEQKANLPKRRNSSPF